MSKVQRYSQQFRDYGIMEDEYGEYCKYSELSATQQKLEAAEAENAELTRKLDEESNLKNLYRCELAQTADKRDELTKLLSEAKSKAVPEDSARLDWLIQHCAFLSHSRDGEVCNVWFSQDPNDELEGQVPVEGYPQKCYNDARQAIDAAMLSAAPQPETDID